MTNKKLRILYITQKVDYNDDILGAVHYWIDNFSTKVEKLYVSCLALGMNKLPQNCQVFSLGKEKGENNFKYVLNFYKQVIPLIFKKKIDGIFVHMNQQYIFLLMPFFPVLKLLGIPIVWWKSHGNLSPAAKFAIHFVNRIVTSADSAFPINTKKKRVIGHGIDTLLFKPNDFKNKNELINIISIGRLSPVKKYDLLLKAIQKVKIDLPETKLQFKIYGQLAYKNQQNYYDNLIDYKRELGLDDIILFEGPVPNHEMPKVINQADFVVNPGGSNSLDKAVVESMACEKIVVDSNSATLEILEQSDLSEAEQTIFLFKRGDYKDMAEKIKNVINLDKEKKASIEQRLRQLVVINHNVDHMSQKIVDVFNEV